MRYDHMETFIVLELRGQPGYAWRWKDKLRREGLMYKAEYWNIGVEELMIVTFYQPYNWERSLLALKLKYQITVILAPTTTTRYYDDNKGSNINGGDVKHVRKMGLAQNYIYE